MKNRPDLLHMADIGQAFFKLEDFDASKENLLILTGDNASGKSLLRRVIIGNCQDEKIHARALSQQKRTTSDMSRAFIYGSEDDDSTGAITLRSVTGLFRKTNTKDGDPVVLIVDEPEIGLGEEAQLGIAKFIKREIENLLPTTNVVQTVIISHSRIILSELSELPHTYFHIQNTYKTIDEYLNRKIVAIEPAQIEDIARANWQIIQKIMDNYKEKK